MGTASHAHKCTGGILVPFPTTAFAGSSDFDADHWMVVSLLERRQKEALRRGGIGPEEKGVTRYKRGTRRRRLRLSQAAAPSGTFDVVSSLKARCNSRRGLMVESSRMRHFVVF